MTLDPQSVLALAVDLLEGYADWIKRNVMSANIEEHPYLPELEGAAEDLREVAAALAAPQTDMESDSHHIPEGWQLSVADGHAGYGVYAHMTEYPEEGTILLQALSSPAPSAEQDRKRLDWLESQNDAMWQDKKGQWSGGNGAAIREAIDLAMKEERNV